MRITGGERKGLLLRVSVGLTTRPTAAVVREAIFDILGADVRGSRVLDLFAGSGSLGIEALSRGACTTFFVEESPVACRIIKGNLARAGYLERSRIIRNDVFKALAYVERQGKAFDLVLLDPPYGSGLSHRTLEVLMSSSSLSPTGRIVVEHAKREVLPERVGALAKERTRNYGDTAVSIYRQSQHPEGRSPDETRGVPG